MTRNIQMPIIGGHHDGERVEFDPKEEYLRIPYIPEDEIEKMDFIHSKMGKYLVEEYRIHHISVDYKVFYYLDEKNLSGEESIEKLIQGYQSKQKLGKD